MMKTIFFSFVVVALSVSAFAQGVVKEDVNVHGRPGWVIENGKLHVEVLKNGGHLAEIRFISPNPQLALNPMFVPQQGNGYMGHMVCFPNFGPASPEERANGIGGHGEANSVDWTLTKPAMVEGGNVVFYYGADLPKTQYRIERIITLKANDPVIRVQESVENLTAYDRPYNWDEHATFGAPFIAPGKTFFDTSAVKGLGDPRAGNGKRTGQNQWVADKDFTWPNAPTANGGTISLREFRAMPGSQVYTSLLNDASKPSSWFTMFNTDYPVLVGYVFPTDMHLWTVDWQNLPQSGAGTARGIEFGTSPIDEGNRKSVERAQLLGAPTYKFITAKQRLTTTFNIFLAEIPKGFAGVKDVRDDGTHITITERGTSRELRVGS